MRALIRWLFETLIRLYFPSIRVQCAEKIPRDVPLVFVLNHPNGLLDPIVLRVAIGRPVGFLAKSTLFKNPLGRLAMEAFSALPAYRQKDVAQGGGDTSRNEETFALCRKALARGEALALFPEGVSHSDPQLKPLKTGAARIALSAEREHAGALGVHVVPVGVAYAARAVFRSEVVLVIGDAIAVRDHYDAYLADERPAVDALTQLIKARLDAVVLQAETRELLDGVARIAVWTADAPAIRDAPELAQQRARELLALYDAMRTRDPARVERVVANAQGYMAALAALGVSDPWALELERVRVGAALRVIAKLVALMPVAIVGAALGWVPYRLAGRLAGRIAREEDVLGTVKLLAGTLFLVVTWSIESLVAGLAWGAPWALAVMFAGPVCGYAALRFDETRKLVMQAARNFWIRGAHPDTLQRLSQRRRELATEVATALRER